jgi:hypothetical protein
MCKDRADSDSHKASGQQRQRGTAHTDRDTL